MDHSDLLVTSGKYRKREKKRERERVGVERKKILSTENKSGSPQEGLN